MRGEWRITDTYRNSQTPIATPHSGLTDSANATACKETSLDLPRPPLDRQTVSFREWHFHPPCHQAGSWILLHSAFTVEFTFRIILISPLVWRYKQLILHLSAKSVEKEPVLYLTFRQLPVAYRKALVLPSTYSSQLQPSSWRYIEKHVVSLALQSALHLCDFDPAVTLPSAPQEACLLPALVSCPQRSHSSMKPLFLRRAPCPLHGSSCFRSPGCEFLTTGSVSPAPRTGIHEC